MAGRKRCKEGGGGVRVFKGAILYLYCELLMAIVDLFFFYYYFYFPPLRKALNVNNILISIVPTSLGLFGR